MCKTFLDDPNKVDQGAFQLYDSSDSVVLPIPRRNNVPPPKPPLKPNDYRSAPTQVDVGYEENNSVSNVNTDNNPPDDSTRSTSAKENDASDLPSTAPGLPPKPPSAASLLRNGTFVMEDGNWTAVDKPDKVYTGRRLAAETSVLPASDTTVLSFVCLILALFFLIYWFFSRRFSRNDYQKPTLRYHAHARQTPRVRVSV